MKEYEQKICNIVDNMKAEIRYQCDRIQEQAYKQGYATGYDRGNEDGLKDGYEDGQESLVNAYAVGKGEYILEDIKKAEYNRGLADMLEVAKAIRMMTADELKEVFGLLYIGDIFVNLSPSKIISKYHAFKAQIKELEDAEIKVGDEVRLIGSDFEISDCDYGICTYVEKENIYVMRKDGSVGEEHKAEWIKTNRTFPQIAEVLAELRGTENDE